MTVTRLVLALMLALLGGSAAAEWVHIGVADDGTVFYADPAIVRMPDSRIKMWVLLDYKTSQKNDDGGLYLSAKLLHEYDCTDDKARTLYFSLHAGKMGAGNRVYSESRHDGEWLPARRVSTGEALWEFACRKK